MIKKLVLVFIAIFAIQLYAQEGTASLYSFYGIGSQKFKGTAENRSMGGLSIYTDSIHVNLRNPASYATPNLTYFNNESRPIKFSVGSSYSSLNLKSTNNTDNASAVSFDYLAMSIPMGKFGFGFGIMPSTAVGYKLDNNNTAGDLLNRFQGEGGLNKAFLGFGYQIVNGLSVGVDAQYNFGNVQNSIIEFVYDDDDVPLQYQSKETNRADLSGLNFNLGLSYKQMLNEKLEIVSGVTYSIESKLSSKNERSYSTILYDRSTGDEFVYSNLDVDLEALGLKETDLILPSKVSVGLGVGQPRKWFVGTEYLFQNTSNLKNVILSSGNNATFKDASTISFGGFYIPEYNSFTSYFKRVVYRGGVYVEDTGLTINNEDVKEFGMSFGVGLPVGDVFSNVNIGLEIGKRGSTNSNLIQENFINLQLSLSLNDKWFGKHKYD
ncbi:hypothetical protein APS56_08605 [Pseudalgibacter alginicilyticus]|uniref:Uncharacterized protein n=1 Tax=Pseudalgibacter alginicilyticus TaxID=1736674 RepID=A0A0P0DAU3_9FLAO|nr:hypothetical protein [Pseudalgibacter alginicilyticus]ALJ05180.1 hypothetical protein APS56_08605 [Pseudalgibacter alginicilyticus]